MLIWLQEVNNAKDKELQLEVRSYQTRTPNYHQLKDYRLSQHVSTSSHGLILFSKRGNLEFLINAASMTKDPIARKQSRRSILGNATSRIDLREYSITPGHQNAFFS